MLALKCNDPNGGILVCRWSKTMSPAIVYNQKVGSSGLADYRRIEGSKGLVASMLVGTGSIAALGINVGPFE